MNDLPCNNVAECRNVFLALSTDGETETAARVHGWRVWRYGTMDLVLCPQCVGYRVRRDPAPERLDGEEPLF